MNADPQLREHLHRAAAAVRVDPERGLDQVRGAAPHRQRVRRVASLAFAAVIGLVAVVVAWRLLPLGDRSHTPGTSVGPTGRIAYMSLTRPLTHRDTSELFFVDASSGEVTPVHQGAGFAIVPQWSPDGGAIAFASNETAQGAYGIFVAKPDGTGAVNILDPNEMLKDGGSIALSWSPDGSRLAYAGTLVGTGRSGVWIVKADGSGGHRVLDGPWETVSWSPDGDRLLLTGNPMTNGHTGQIDIYAVRTDGSGLEQLTRDALIERWPVWSPDGTRILFAKRSVEFTNKDYGQDVYVMDADGSHVRRLTRWRGFDSFAVWSPDGAWIAFASDRDASPDQQRGNRGNRPFSGVSLYVMRPDGSGVRRVLDGGDVALLPSSWSS